MNFCWHKWDRWQEPEPGVRTVYLYASIERFSIFVQQRVCKKCGKVDLRRVAGND